MSRSARFTLIAAAGFALGGAPAAPALAASPLIEVSVVTRSGDLLGPLQVRAKQTTVKLGKRRCTVASGTALAALTALKAKKAAGVPALKLTDESACGKKPSSASGLYLTAIGKDRAFAGSGWVYDVDGRRGTAGAADAKGPFGTGKRIKSGAFLNWRWCDLDADPDGGCGPELRLTVPAKASAAQPLTVKVAERTGPDGDERNAPARAGVTLIAESLSGTELARGTTVAGGSAQLALPAGTTGRVRVIARQDGFDPAGRLVVVTP